MLERIVAAVLVGVAVGLVVALLVFIVSMLLPGASLDPSFWGTVIGLLAGLYTLITGWKPAL